VKIPKQELKKTICSKKLD